MHLLFGQDSLTFSGFCFTMHSPGDLAHTAKGRVIGLLGGASQLLAPPNSSMERKSSLSLGRRCALPHLRVTLAFGGGHPRRGFRSSRAPLARPNLHKRAWSAAIPSISMVGGKRDRVSQNILV